MKDGRLQGKVCFVTGAGGGLGQAQIRMMAREGAKVVAANLRSDGVLAPGSQKDALWQRASGAVEEINGNGGEALLVELDVANEQSWLDAVGAAVDRFGRVDVLSNNAGIYLHRGVLEHTVEDFYRIVSVNQLGVLLGMKHVIPVMKQGGGGSIINFSSIYGIAGAGVSTAYQGTKGAVRLMSKSVALEVVAQNIRVNSIHPGMFDTNLFESSVPKEAWEALISLVPMKRFGRPDEIAYAVVFLASDESSFITGSEVVVDGGYTCP